MKMGVQVVEYLAYQLIGGYQSGDEEVKSLLDYYDFYIVPFHNPDGKRYLSVFFNQMQETHPLKKISLII